MKREYRKVSLSDIKPYVNNPRKNDKAVETVRKSIEQCGYVAPIIVDENLEILAGHTRYKALRELNRMEDDVLVVSGMSDEQKRKYRLLDNKTNELATWDASQLAVELEGIDFGDIDDIDWGINDNDVFVDLDEESAGKGSDNSNAKTVYRCPKCGFEFEA